MKAAKTERVEAGENNPVGVIGLEARKDYAAIHRVVNLASPLCSEADWRTVSEGYQRLWSLTISRGVCDDQVDESRSREGSSHRDALTFLQDCEMRQMEVAALASNYGSVTRFHVINIERDIKPIQLANLFHQ
jgi:hypothetical protein